MINFKVGILGAGHIAGVIAETLSELGGFECYAIASRDKDKADRFAEKYGVAKSYGSYDELIADSDVELVYIATVNTTHAELARRCIEAGKPCLVEKPFSYSTDTVKPVLDLAAEKKVFCSEAMWLRYHPVMIQAVAKLRAGIIGDPRYIEASLGYNLMDKERLLKPELAGGSLLDLGVYPLTAMFMIMGGPPIAFSSGAMKLNTGVDAQQTINLKYPNSRVATVYSTMMSETPNNCTVYGSNGYMEIQNINNPERATIYDSKGEVIEELERPDDFISGYEYEFLAAREAIIVGRTETKEYKSAQIYSLYVMTDQLRNSWGALYDLPGEADPEKLRKAQLATIQMAEKKRAEAAAKKQ